MTDQIPVSQDTIDRNPTLKDVLVRTDEPLYTVKQNLTVPKESETDFASWFEDFLHLHGYKFSHSRPGMTSRTYTNKRGETKNVWVTPLSGEDGMPDYHIWHERKRFNGWAELKSDTGLLSAKQKKTIASMQAAGEIVFIWRPKYRTKIEKLLA